jgi:hypothetical protein
MILEGLGLLLAMERPKDPRPGVETDERGWSLPLVRLLASIVFPHPIFDLSEHQDGNWLLVDDDHS